MTDGPMKPAVDAAMENIRESELGRKIQIKWSLIGARVFRNNVGVLKDDRGRRVRYGLCNGSSDYIGWKPVIITPEMVGQTVAVFVACEVKTSEGRVSDQQSAFLDTVRSAGGIGIIARSEADIHA